MEPITDFFTHLNKISKLDFKNYFLNKNFKFKVSTFSNSESNFKLKY